MSPALNGQILLCRYGGPAWIFPPGGTAGVKVGGGDCPLSLVTWTKSMRGGSWGRLTTRTSRARPAWPRWGAEKSHWSFCLFFFLQWTYLFCLPQSLGAACSPVSVKSGDRFIPTRAGSNWSINFHYANVRPSSSHLLLVWDAPKTRTAHSSAHSTPETHSDHSLIYCQRVPCGAVF